VEHAVHCLDELVGRSAIKNKTFLDIGSGSGLSSLAAKRLGASRVVAFDNDPESVACTREVAGATCEVLQGSLLDEAFVRSLGTFDVVYAWGVVHHTWDMGRALANAMTPARRLLAVAVYNRVVGKPLVLSSETWARIKRAYSASGRAKQDAMLAAYVASRVVLTLGSLRNPLRDVHEYEQSRGMSWMHDARDWIGGYPYEFASCDELERFAAENDFRTVRFIPVWPNGTGNNQVLFERET
jgi:SAM-dependent methyltransferase